MEAGGLAVAAALEDAAAGAGVDAGELPQAANPAPRAAGTTSPSAIERRQDLDFAGMELPLGIFVGGAERDQSLASPGSGTIPLAATFERRGAARRSGGCPYPLVG
ncbi:hypothetical protein Afe04nite_68040 [Asanoa ferruginea]|nr:hypothetical protein Afe04nite_68040 [Asanoa ferruginea]